MRSLLLTTFGFVALSANVGARVVQILTPIVTSGPSISSTKIVKRDTPDAASLAQILLTAIPASLRELAATNVPAASSILWHEFLDENKPQWFLDLPFDVQSYLIKQYGPATAVPTASPTGSTSARTTSVSSSHATPATASSSSYSTSSPTSTSTSHPAPVVNKTGLTRSEKLKLGLGIPFGIIGVALLILGAILILRRCQRKRYNGSIPPSSPGFIPAFAFQEKPTGPFEHQPLNRGSFNQNDPFQDVHHNNWDDDDIVGSSSSGETIPTMGQVHGSQPIMAPALFSHSSNRARGKRTSYTSLHSVPEANEFEESGLNSPALPVHNGTARSSLLRNPPSRQSLKNGSPPRSSVAAPPLPTSLQIKRRPVSTIDKIPTPLAADIASQSLARQSMPDHFPFPTQSATAPTGFGTTTHISANNASNSRSPYVTPMDELSRNPFSDSNAYLYSYEEDYRPEYYTSQHPVSISNPPAPPPKHAARDSHHSSQDERSDDTLNILYGGNTDLTRYPTSSSSTTSPKHNHSSSKTEWPLKNFPGPGSAQKRESSPLWDKVYVSP